MAFNLADFDLMQYLWDVTEKSADEKFLEYAEQDIGDLWRIGFIDTEKISQLEWKKAVLPFKQASGTYKFSYADFMKLDQFRYKGELFVPFDPMKINEGFYSDQGIQELFDASIKPSITAPEHEYIDYIKNFKKKYRDTSNELVRIDHDAKNFIRILFDLYPSPLRNLELIFDKLIQQQKHGSAQNEIAYGIAKQVSAFRAQPSHQVEAEALALKDLVKSKTPQREKDSAKDAKTVALKNVRRSPRGTRS